MKTVLALAFLPLMGTAAMANSVDAVEGQWRTVMHGADVRIADCGNGTPCAYLIHVDTSITGGETRDIRNKKKALRTRPLTDLPIFWGYKSSASGWTSGRLYNPATGQTFRSSITPISHDAIRVRGCLGPLCRAQVWTRIVETPSSKMDTQNDKS